MYVIFIGNLLMSYLVSNDVSEFLSDSVLSFHGDNNSGISDCDTRCLFKWASSSSSWRTKSLVLLLLGNLTYCPFRSSVGGSIVFGAPPHSAVLIPAMSFSFWEPEKLHRTSNVPVDDWLTLWTSVFWESVVFMPQRTTIWPELLEKSSSPTFKEILLTMYFPCVTFWKFVQLFQ